MAPAEQAPGRSRKRGISATLIAALGALGILSAVGALVVNSAVETGRDVVLEPLAVDVIERTGSPNFFFPAVVDPGSAPISLESNGDDLFRDWAVRAGGIPYYDRSLELTLRGRDATPVVVSSVRVRVVARTPLAGEWVNSWEGCGAETPVRVLTVDLATDPPIEKLIVDEVEKNDAVFQVSETEIEVFRIDLTAGAGLVSWVIDVKYNSRGKDGVLTVTSSAGKPFQLAGGGSPVIYSTIVNGDRLARDDDAAALLSSEGVLC